jgi:hypothetical protein
MEAEVTDDKGFQDSSRQSKESMMRAKTNAPEKRPLSRPTAGIALVVCALLGAGSIKCSLAAPWSPEAFRSPDDASRALVSAVQEHDERTVMKILRGGISFISSDDKADALDRERFVQKYQEMHRFRESRGIATLYIGAENWPFPIPLVSRNGVWRFDSKAGSDEILFRRIGENEVTAIVTCDMLVTAVSNPGADGEADRAAGMLLPQEQNARKPNSFHGYYFHMLPSESGGLAAIAYPVMYRSSGVMTFIVTQDRGVSERDFGPNTAKIASAMTSYHPDATWMPLESKP